MMLARCLGLAMVLGGLGAVSPRPVLATEYPPPPPAAMRALEAGGITGWLILPTDRPVLGLVVLLPDAGGAEPRSAPYVEQLLGGGLAVFDVFTGVADPNAIPALPAVAGLPGVPLGVVGFGAGAREALRLGTGIAARVLLYPGCGEAAVSAAVDAVMVVHGDDDAANTVADCAELADRLAGAGRPVRRIAYAGAGYAWDHPAYGHEQRILLPHPDGLGRVAARPWPELTALSASQVAGFLAAMLARGAP